jgi:adenosylhomocysteinase
MDKLFMTSRIKNFSLASEMDLGLLAWHRHITPVTEYYSRVAEQSNHKGKSVAYWGHITFNVVPMLFAIKASGAELIVGACNAESTNDVVAAYLVSQGIPVVGWQGMTEQERVGHLENMLEFNADYLCDTGGELCTAYADRSVKGAIEATTSGIHLLRQQHLNFPIFEWNSIALKDRFENRFHVGDGIWTAFNIVTGLGLFGKHVLVIGYGPVGKGIAERARTLGAMVHVSDLDPIRLLEARHHGCNAVTLEQGLQQAHIIVTATGVEKVLREEHFRQLKDGAMLLNAGHSGLELDTPWLYQQPFETMTQHIDRFTLEGKTFYLLTKGNLLNLAAGVGPQATELFDAYTAIMLGGLLWLMDGLPDGIQPTLQPYPAHLEKEIAKLLLRSS